MWLRYDIREKIPFYLNIIWRQPFVILCVFCVMINNWSNEKCSTSSAPESAALVLNWPESIWLASIMSFREQLWMLSKETIYIYNVWNTDNKTLSKFRDMYYSSILLWCIHSWAYWIILGPHTWERTLSAIVNSDGIHWFTSTICLATVLSIYAYLIVLHKVIVLWIYLKRTMASRHQFEAISFYDVYVWIPWR